MQDFFHYKCSKCNRCRANMWDFPIMYYVYTKGKLSSRYNSACTFKLSVISVRWKDIGDNLFLEKAYKRC